MPNGKAENTENKVGTATVKSKSKSYASEISTLGADSENLETTLLEGTPQALAAAAYVPKTWVDGEVIYEDDLNHMEQGIAANAEAIEEVNADLTDMWTYNASSASDTNLNGLDSGLYLIRNCENAPISGAYWWFIFSFIANANTGMQIATQYNTNSGLFKRYMTGGNWSSWMDATGVGTNPTSLTNLPPIVEES